MKMGTLRSPCRYDAARQATPQLACVAKTTLAFYDLLRAPIVILASPSRAEFE